MPDYDPPTPHWKLYGYSSEEAFIEAKAGACPEPWRPGMVLPEVDDWPLTHPVWPPEDEALGFAGEATP